MASLGSLEVEYYQLTPIGVQKIQSGIIPRSLDQSSRQILDFMAKSGGTAEIDELKLISQSNPIVIRNSLKDLIDLGYVTPVQLQQQQVGGVG
jgi:hypothetical protein